MHIITFNKLLPTQVNKILIAAASLEMNLKLPNKVRLVAPGIDKVYDVTSYDISGVKEAPTRD
jgi:hypothetical protein